MIFQQLFIVVLSQGIYGQSTLKEDDGLTSSTRLQHSLLNTHIARNNIQQILQQLHTQNQIKQFTAIPKFTVGDYLARGQVADNAKHLETKGKVLNEQDLHMLLQPSHRQVAVGPPYGFYDRRILDSLKAAYSTNNAHRVTQKNALQARNIYLPATLGTSAQVIPSINQGLHSNLPSLDLLALQNSKSSVPNPLLFDYDPQKISEAMRMLIMLQLWHNLRNHYQSLPLQSKHVQD